MRLINIGFGNMVNADRIVAVVVPDSAPVKRIIQNSKDMGKLIDVTQGRKTQSVIFTDSEHIILSYLRAEKIADKMSYEINSDVEE